MVIRNLIGLHESSLRHNSRRDHLHAVHQRGGLLPGGAGDQYGGGTQARSLPECVQRLAGVALPEGERAVLHSGVRSVPAAQPSGRVHQAGGGELSTLLSADNSVCAIL